MKTLAILAYIIACSATCYGAAKYYTKEELIQKSDIIAIYHIKELVLNDYLDDGKKRTALMAKGYAAEVIKGSDIVADIQRSKRVKDFNFMIPKFFPCAMFDVSTGEHIVFLRKYKDVIVGTNWENSYIYVSGGKRAEWNFSKDKEDKITPIGEIIADIRTIIESQRAEPGGSINSEAAPLRDTP